MPTITISGFDKGGLNTDLPEWDLQPNQLTDGENFRCENGAVKSFGGQESWANHPASTDYGFITYVETDTSAFWVHAGTGSTTETIVAYDGSTFHNVKNTAVGAYTNVTDYTKWTSCMIGGISVLNNSDNFPEYWMPATGNDYADLPFDTGAGSTWRSLGYKASVMRSHRNFLIAFGTTEGGNYYEDKIRWSHTADVASVPTDWDDTDATNLAGSHVLAGEGGVIVDAMTLRNGIAVYQESSIWQMEYVGGTYVWSFRRLPVNVGCIATNCVVPVLNGHVFLSDGDILFNDGTNVRSIIHKRLKKRLIETVDADNYANSYLTVQRQNKEVWVCVPSTGNTYPNKAFIWNYMDDTWSIRDLPSAPMIGYGVKPETGVALWSDFNGIYWTADTGSWLSRNYTPLDDVLIATLPDAATPATVVIDPIVQNDGASFETVLERTNFDILGEHYSTTIKRVIPHMKGTKAVTVEIGSHSFPGSDITWKPSTTFTPGTSQKIDVRTTGRLHAFRLTGSSDPNFELSGITIEYEVLGTR